MAEHLLYPEWRSQNGGTLYPFSEAATLVADSGVAVPPGLFLDAALHPVGGGAGLYMPSVVVGHGSVTVYVGNESAKTLCSGTFDLVRPPDSFALADSLGRPAGLVVSESARLAAFQSWGVGTHSFTRAASEFAATVCFPTPEVTVRGVLLDDGSLLTGDVWLVGGAGVVLREEAPTLPGSYGVPAGPVRCVRVDVVGDPLFRRRACDDAGLFTTPRFVKAVRFVGPNGEDFTAAPDERGDVRVVVNNGLAAATVLRVSPADDGVVFSAVGSPIGG